MSGTHESALKKSALAELQAFVAIADARSFARAAQALGVSPSALSHTMRALEARLGVALLARTTRSVAPTEAGERLLLTLRPAFEEISLGLRTVGELSGRPSGTLRITTFKHAATSVLLPVLPRYIATYPDVRVEVILDDHRVDIVAEGYDAGIRYAQRVDKDMVAITLGGPVRLAIVGAPSYFERHAVPRSPGDLSKHRCINYKFGRTGAVYSWELERKGRKKHVKVDGPLVFNDGDLIVRAALDGQGLTCYFESEIAPHVEAGRLVRVLPQWAAELPPLQLYYPSRKQLAPALAALVPMLREAHAAPRRGWRS